MNGKQRIFRSIGFVADKSSAGGVRAHETIRLATKIFEEQIIYCKGDVMAVS